MQQVVPQINLMMPPEQSAFSASEEYKRVESMRQPQSYPGSQPPPIIVQAENPPDLIDRDNVTISGPPDKQVVDEKQEQVLDSVDKTHPNGNRYKG